MVARVARDDGRRGVDVDAVVEERAVRHAPRWVHSVAAGLVALDDRADRGVDDSDTAARVPAGKVARDKAAVGGANSDAGEGVAGRVVVRDHVVVGVVVEQDARVAVVVYEVRSMRLRLDPSKMPMPDPFRELEFLVTWLLLDCASDTPSPTANRMLRSISFWSDRKSWIPVSVPRGRCGKRRCREASRRGVDEEDPEVAVVGQPDAHDALSEAPRKKMPAREPCHRPVEDAAPDGVRSLRGFRC